MGKGGEVAQAWAGLASREKRQRLCSQSRVVGDKARSECVGLECLGETAVLNRPWETAESLKKIRV